MKRLANWRANWRADRLALVIVCLTLVPHAAAEAVDPTTGLIMAPGWEMVRAHCGACHSYQLVIAQRGDRDFWLKTIRWMQKTQNLWPIEANQEQAIVAYLAAEYDESGWGRRPNLPRELRPDFSDKK